MKFLSTSFVILGLGLALSAHAATLTADPLTGLPLYPATDSRLHLGNDPTKIPDSQICKSHMQANFYVVYDSRIDASLAWYTANLAGFHKSHAYSNGRSRDAFYNDAGTQVVIVTGDPGKDGENVGTHGIVYYSFKPGLPAKTIIGFTQEKFTCQ